MRTATISLGRKTYEITALPIRAAREWREKFNGPLRQVMEIFQVTKIEFNSPADLGKLVGPLKDVLLGSLDFAADMLFAYSPALEQDRARIEVEAFDDEVIAAFVEVIKLAFPFGELVSLVRGLQSKATLTSSSGPSGASGQMS